MTAIVAFVLNDARHDSRVLREARSLATAGFDVTLVARTVDPLAPAPTIARGPFTILRVPLATGPLRWAQLFRRPRGALATLDAELRRDPIGTAPVLVGLAAVAIPAVLAAAVLAAVALAGRRIGPAVTLWRGLSWRLSWHLSVLPWARRAAREAARMAPDAAVIWAHDLRTLPAAIELHRLLGGGAIVYDSHEIFAEAGDHATRPLWARTAMARLERGLARNATALVTVNGQLAERLGPDLGLERVVVVHNCPPRWSPPASPWVSPLRAAAGVPDGAPILLYHGGLAPGRGIVTLADAMADPRLASAHLIFMGSGPSRDIVAGFARMPGSRIHLLAPVAPDDLPVWVAGADVAVAPIEPTTLNHRLSSPNKVFEAVAAGLPVVGSDLPGIREVLLADPSAPLGTLVDPTDPSAVASAVADLLDRPPGERAALRARCLAAAHDRWNWETEGAGIVALVHDLAPRPRPDVPDVPEAPVPQRIAIVLPSDGRHDARTRRLATDLATRGHLVTIVARESDAAPAGSSALEGVPAVRVIRVRTRASATVPAALASGPLRPIGVVWRSLAVAQTARRQATAARTLALEADLVHAMGFLGLPPARAIAGQLGVPLVYDARDLYVESNNIARLPRPFRSAFAGVEGRWARAAARVFTVNQSLADHLERRYGVRRPVVVMNGQRDWAAPAASPDLIRARLILTPDRRIVLYHGGFMPDRGLPELIAAAGRPELADTDLVLMGTGAIEARVRALAAASPAAGRIHVLPPVDPAELLAWVASADVGVMPNQPRTLNERLSTPNKLFECLAAGTPVVSSDFPERRRILTSDPAGPLGRLCDPTDPASIATAIRAVLDLSPAEAAAIRARCRLAARSRYDWASQAARALAAYSQITGSPW